MIAGLLVVALGAQAAEWRAMVGGQFDPDSHGALDLGVREGPWSAQLLTDTIDLRWAPEGERGRAWVASRTELGAVGLLITPWQGGRPAPEQGIAGFYTGGEAGALAYLPAGAYLGVSGMAYYTWFSEIPATEVEVPGPTPWLRAEAVAGWYGEAAHAWVQAGAQHDRFGAAVQPHVQLTATTHWEAPARWAVPVVPRAELRAGWSAGQSFLTRARVGGLNPYVVPVAGAGWAEWWADQYAVSRLGPELQLHLDGENHRLTHSLVADAGFVWTPADGRLSVWGLGLLSRYQRDRVWVQGDLGWGGGVPRAPGVAPWCGWVAVGRDWG